MVGTGSVSTSSRPILILRTSTRMVGAMRLSKLSRSIDGKRALVTGAASGMGRATAHLFADEGAKVAVVDLGQDRVDAVVA